MHIQQREQVRRDDQLKISGIQIQRYDQLKLSTRQYQVRA